LFGGEVHDLRGVSAGGSLAPTSWLILGVSGNHVEQIDFRNGGEGDVVRLSPSLDARLGRQVEAAMRHSYQRLEKEGAEVFTAHAGELKGVYNLSTRAFVRGLLQYRRTQRNHATNPRLDQPLQETVFSQVLFSYKVNPLTVFFLGFTDDRAGFIDLDGDVQNRVDLTPRGRTIFMKLGYAWRP
jgi:hypothetical protein